MRSSFAILLIAASFGCTDRGPERPTDHLIENINGYTWRDDGIHRFAALRFNDQGVVVATYPDGSLPTASTLQRIDGHGMTLLPGLIDAHGHVLALGQSYNQVDLVGTRSLTEALERIADFAAAAPPTPWILGRGWNQVLWTENRFPTAADLDALNIDRPIWLSRVDGHAGWANTAALQLAGIDASTPDPDGGRILRDETGNATGVLIDIAQNIIDKIVPAPTREQRKLALETALNELASLGLTSVHDAGIDLEVAGLYRELNEHRRMPIRVYAMLSEDIWQAYGAPLKDDGSGHLAISSVKVYLDGALGSRGAALMAPYSDEPGNSGLLFKTKDEFTQLATAVAAAGFQVNVHAIGDAANRVALDGFASLGDASTLRHRIEHAQVIDLADMPRFAQLGVIASVQPTHATSDMNMAEDRVGAQRIQGAYAWRRLLSAGARIAAGSDFPVERPNPMFGLHAAITRQDHSGQPERGWYSEQALTPREALRAFTLDAAYAAHQEQQLGTLEPGKRADFILLDRDLFTSPATRLWQATVMETWVNGQQVYPVQQ